MSVHCPCECLSSKLCRCIISLWVYSGFIYGCYIGLIRQSQSCINKATHNNIAIYTMKAMLPYNVSVVCVAICSYSPGCFSMQDRGNYIKVLILGVGFCFFNSLPTIRNSLKKQKPCTGHSYSYSVGSWYFSYTLTGLQEHSVYSISLVAVTSNDVRSSSTTRQVTTMSAGKLFLSSCI